MFRISCILLLAGIASIPSTAHAQKALEEAEFFMERILGRALKQTDTQMRAANVRGEDYTDELENFHTALSSVHAIYLAQKVSGSVCYPIELQLGFDPCLPIEECESGDTACEECVEVQASYTQPPSCAAGAVPVTVQIDGTLFNGRLDRWTVEVTDSYPDFPATLGVKRECKTNRESEGDKPYSFCVQPTRWGNQVYDHTINPFVIQ